MLAIAEVLVARGHSITVFATGDVREPVERTGHTFRILGDGSSRMPEISAKPGGLLGMFTLIREMARTTQMMIDGLLPVLKSGRIDLMLVDQLEPGAGLATRIAGVPYISVANALPINRDPGVPPYFSPWTPDTGRWGQERDKGAYRVYDLMLEPVGRVLRAAAAAHGISGCARAEDCLAPVSIGQVSPGFDFPRAGSSLDACGPFRSARSRYTAVDMPTGRPVVFASFGTLLGGRFDLFSRIAAACDDLGVALVIAHGGRLNAQQVSALERQAQVHAFVDQAAMLARADVAVTHAGMNTVMDILKAGRPCVALPFAYDQPGVAARVAHAGTGVRLIPGRASRRRLRDALDRVLRDDVAAARARVLGSEIAQLGGARRAADIVERALSTALS